jgi:glycosyltransferase involved in cell wall biosynthesis
MFKALFWKNEKKKTMKKILVGIPVYNSENGLKLLFNELNENLDPLTVDILFVDNCSTDKSMELLHAYRKENYFVIQNEVNLGLGGSQKKIFDFARFNNYELVVIFHSDLQPVAREINIGLKVIMQSNSLDALLGSRFHLQSQRINYSLTRAAGNVLLNIFYSLFFRRIIWDLGSGLNIYRVNTLIDYKQLPNDLSFNCNLLIYQLFSKQFIAWYPITWREGINKSNARVIPLALATLYAPFKWFAKRIKL